MISFIVHAGIVGSGLLPFHPVLKDKPFDVAFEVEEEVLPEVFEVREEKRVEPPVIEREELLEPVPDEIKAEGLKPAQEDEEHKKSLLRYQDSIKQRIQKEKQYPRWALRARHQGVVRIVFDVLPAGLVKNLSLLQSSGFKELDEEALDAVKRASPFDPFPEVFSEDEIQVEVAIIFTFREK